LVAKKSKPLLTACLIARNEAENIEHCLASLKPVVDEIVLVDTGSTDETVDIARRYGARVYHQPWEDDFSAPRNRGLEEARGEWILVIDADERLVPVDRKFLRRLLRQTPYEGFFITVNNILEPEKAPEVSAPVFRLFRNRPWYRFSGRVHEQILPAIYRAGGQVAHLDLNLEHIGYTREKQREKRGRNLRLLEREVQEGTKPTPFQLYNLGMEHLRDGDPDRGREYLKEAWEVDGVAERPFGTALIRRLVLTLIQAGAWDEALKYVEEGIEKFPDFADLHYFRGQILKEKGEPGAALDEFRRCLSLPRQLRYPHLKGVNGYRTWFEIGLIHEKLGNQVEAREAYLKALEEKPDLVPALDRLAGLLTSAGGSKGEIEIRERLRRQIAEGSTDAYRYLTARLLLDNRAWKEALTFLCQVGEDSPYFLPAQREVAFVNLLLGEPAQALQALKRLAESQDFVADAWAHTVLLGLMEEKGAGELPPVKMDWAPKCEEAAWKLLDQLVAAQEFDLFEKALVMFELLGREEAWISLELGKFLYRKGFTQVAVEQLVKAYKEGYRDVESLSIFGDICFEDGEYEDAARYYEEATDEDDPGARVYVALAKCYLHQKRFETALDRVREGLKRYQDSQLLAGLEAVVKKLAGEEVPVAARVH